MTTLRIARRRQYVRTDARTVNDPRLSLRALGLLVWLLEKPDDWTVRADSIAKTRKEGRDAIRTALRELEAAGYLLRLKWRATDGTWRSEHIVYEYPQPVDEQGTMAGNQHRLTSAGQPAPENQASYSRHQPKESTDPLTPAERGNETPVGSKRARGENPRAQATNPRAADELVARRKAAEHAVDLAARCGAPPAYPAIAWLVYEAPGGEHWGRLVAMAEDIIAERTEGRPGPDWWFIADTIENALAVAAAA